MGSVIALPLCAQYTDHMSSIITQGQAWRRMLAALRLPRFILDIETTDHPGLLERPVAVVGNGKEPTVLAASPPALAAGIRVGQRWESALQLCPRLGRLRARADYYHSVSQRLQQALADISPRLERVAIDQFYLDLSDCQSYYRYQPQRIAQLIQARLAALGFGFQVELGLAADANTAYLAACHSHDNTPCIISPDMAEAWLAPLPLSQVFDLGAEAQAWFAEQDIQCCAQLKRLPPSLLAQRFGRRGHELWLSAQGQEAKHCALGRARPLPDQQQNKRFFSPSRDASTLLFQLHKLCEKLAPELPATSRARLELSLRTYKGWQHLLLATPDPGLPQGQALFQAAKRAFKEFWLGENILQLRLEAYLEHESRFNQADIFLPAVNPNHSPRQTAA